MRLNAPLGQSVIYVDHGVPWGGDSADGLLKADTIYTIASTTVFRDHSLVRLIEFPGFEFNTIMFEEVGERLPAVSTVAEIYYQGLDERTGYTPYGPDEDEEQPS